MPPDFNKSTIDTIARRAAFLCSNPDCRIHTVGPNTAVEKSTLIGEAAHIFGARPKSKRFLDSMNDAARADITNAIWLCRNCHKLIDTDAFKYTSELLFAWRESHDQYVLGVIGTAGDKLKSKENEKLLSSLSDYPPVIRRIALDKSAGWEWRITAELMDYLNNPVFRKLTDLRDGLTSGEPVHIDQENATKWFRNRFTESDELIGPIPQLIERLQVSWGKPGEDGSLDEVIHICKLIRDRLLQIYKFEEKLNLARLPESYNTAISLYRNVYGEQAIKLQEIPVELNSIYEKYLSMEEGDEKIIVRKDITFELPKGWAKKITKEVHRANNPNSGVGLRTWIFIAFTFYIIFKILVEA